MKFKFDPIRTSKTQSILTTRNANLINVRPHILRFGNPVGNMKVQILNSSGFIIKESALVNMNKIGIGGTATQDYAHGYITFATPFALQDATVYSIAVQTTGYTYSDTNHIGWIRANQDFRKVTKNFTRGLEFDLELWERKIMTREIDFFDGFESSTAPTQGDKVTILNATGPADITGLVFDPLLTNKVRISYTILRRTDSAENREEGIIELQYKPDAAAWTPTIQSDSNYDDADVTFTISGNQLQYTSGNLVGANYSGFIIFDEIVKFGL